MADEVEYILHGDDIQMVEILLDPLESVRAEAGTMTFMGEGIKMETNTGGGLTKGLKRFITGESFFVTNYTNVGNRRSSVAFAAPYPGKIKVIDLGNEHNMEFLCQKSAYLCSVRGVEVTIAFNKRIMTGLFGGEGFILQKLVGDGLVFLHAGGAIVEKKLQADETLYVDTGCVVGFSSTVDYGITRVRGVRNMLFGGEGLFMATLTGPGRVLLQSLPFSRLAHRIADKVNIKSGETTGVDGIGSKRTKRFISGT